MPAEAPVQTVAPGTPGSDPTPVTTSTKSMIADVFSNSPATPVVAPQKAEPTPQPTVTPATPAKPATPKHEPIIKPKEEAAPPTQDLPEDKLQIPANASPEAVKNFAQYKTSMKEILAAERKARADAEARLNVRTTASPAEAAEVERIKAEHKSALDRLAILDLQNHPDFTRQYTQPKKAALAVASEVLAYNGKEGVELAALLAKPMKDFNAAVSEFTKDMNSADAATVATSLREARGLHAKESEALSKSGELHQQLQAKAAAEQKAAFEAVSAEVIPAFAKREVTAEMTPEQKASAEAYNKSVDGLRTRAEARAFGKVTERDVATLAYKEQAFEHMITHAIPTLEAHIGSQNAIIAELSEQLAAVKGTRSPGALAGDHKGQQAPATVKDLIRSAGFKQ